MYCIFNQVRSILNDVKYIWMQVYVSNMYLCVEEMKILHFDK